MKISKNCFFGLEILKELLQKVIDNQQFRCMLKKKIFGRNCADEWHGGRKDVYKSTGPLFYLCGKKRAVVYEFQFQNL